MSYLAVALGGALGSGLRYFLGVQLSASRAGMATFVANILASVVLGMMVGWGAKSPAFYPKLLVVTGFCGGLSTFSMFSFETLELIYAQKYAYAAANILANVFGTIMAVYLGSIFVQKF